MRKVFATVLALLVALSICSCTPSKKTEEKVATYLRNKYGNLTFEMIDFTRDTTTSGRYLVNARCVNTDVTFQLYVSSLMITDSYIVESTNAFMRRELNRILYPDGSTTALASSDKVGITDIQWFSLYEDDSAGYKFRSMDTDVSYDMEEPIELYRVTLRKGATTAEVADIMMNFMTKLKASDVIVKSVTFRFTIGEQNVNFVTDTAAILKTTEATLAARITKGLENKGDENSTIFLRSGNELTIRFFSAAEQ